MGNIISSKSKLKIRRFLRPGKISDDFYGQVPRGLTVRRLIHRKQYQVLKERETILDTDAGLLCVANLVKRGFCIGGNHDYKSPVIRIQKKKKTEETLPSLPTP